LCCSFPVAAVYDISLLKPAQLQAGKRQMWYDKEMITMNDILKEPETVVGIIFNHEGKVAIIKRNCPPQLGLWALPAGERWEWETPLAAMEREVWEETGIVVRDAELLMKDGSVYYFVGYELLRDQEFYEEDLNLSWEVSDFEYVDIQDPRIIEAYPENQKVLDKFFL